MSSDMDMSEDEAAVGSALATLVANAAFSSPPPPTEGWRILMDGDLRAPSIRGRNLRARGKERVGRGGEETKRVRFSVPPDETSTDVGRELEIKRADDYSTISTKMNTALEILFTKETMLHRCNHMSFDNQFKKQLSEIETLKSQIATLTKEKDEEIATLKKEKDEEIATLKKEKDEEITLKKEKEEEIATLKNRIMDSKYT
jgi:hypothetical protein